MKRLDILLRKKLIDTEVHNLCNDVNKRIHQWEKTNKDRFITHLAIALMRIKKNQIVDAPAQEAIDSMKKNINTKKAEDLLQELLRNFKHKIPENEKWFLLMHVINSLNK